jgi:hypothetical protein
MELNITELNNVNSMNPYSMSNFDINNQNEYNYWETNTNKPNEQSKKKKVTFNDILSNMNLVVNKQGVLQYMGMNDESYVQPQYQQQQYQNYFNDSNNNNSSNNYQKLQQNSDPIDPNVKHSYIYNKYFKDYADPNTVKNGPRVPKTIEEYYQMLLDDKIKVFEHKKRVEQIKSKKLLFISVPGSHSNPRNIHATKNNLRMMNFG